MRAGHGEIVCQLIDELVNMELYRRDFEFVPPNLAEENHQSEESEEMAEDEE